MAYALDEMASEEKTASARILFSRSSFSASLGKGLPTRSTLRRVYNRPILPDGRDTAADARKMPGATRRM